MYIKIKVSHLAIVVVLLISLFMAMAVYAGDPDSGDDPASTNSYSLEDIYNRLNDGTAGTQSTFTEPSSGPGTGTGHTLNEIYELIGLRAPVPKTGDSYTDGGVTGEDGELQNGVAWPIPRFITGTTGIVTDTLTGLIWLENANCTTFFSGDGTGQNNRNWINAFTAANSLAGGYCGLTDGSSAGDWRLPNLRELQSLVHYGYVDLAVPNTAGTGQCTTDGDPFIDVESSNYWSSSTVAGLTSAAWYVNMSDGFMTMSYKTNPQYVWPVRGGQ